MKISTTDKRRFHYIAAALVWILVWYLLSLLVKEEIFLPSPGSTVKSLLALVPQSSFWKAVGFTLSRVIAGIVISTVAASLLAALSSFSVALEIFLSPLVKAVRSIPVASVIILVLLWVKSRNLSLVISSLVVFPIIYTSVLSGLENTSYRLLEMASNYHIGRWKKIRYIYIPSVFPFLKSGLHTAVGFAWKSAVAAEVIGLPKNSIGSSIYESKIYLLTSDLFAWSIVIVILSALFEKMTIVLLDAAERRALR